jgi:FtsH-binding integral membrane protein
MGLKAEPEKTLLKRYIQFLQVSNPHILVQLILTAGMCCASLYSLTFLIFQIENNWLMWVCLSMMIVSEIAILCFPAGRKHPINLILLTIFTLCESYFLSFFCADIAIESGNRYIVLIAAIMTLGKY